MGPARKRTPSADLQCLLSSRHHDYARVFEFVEVQINWLKCPRHYARLKIPLLSVVVLSANDSRSIPIERRMERCTLDIRVSPFRQ